MNSVSLKSRSLLSTWFCLFFFVMLALYVMFIEFFQDNRVKQSIENLTNNPVREDILTNIDSIRFKNRIGKFTLTNENKNWVLKEPRVMPANKSTVKKIIDSLKDISVHTIHELEPINIQSFSLDKPTLEIDLFTKLDEKVTIKVGIINPINNTSYLSVSGQKRIYQINLFKNSFESLELSDFIDSRIFSTPLEDIKNFKIFHGKIKEAFNNLSFDGNHWKSKKYNTISDDSTQSTLNSILNINTHMIIDKMDNKLSTFIKNYFDSPLYRVELTTKSNEVISYTITTNIKAITELKLEKRQYFLMKASDRPYPYVINKSYLSNFLIRYSHLK